MAVTVTRRLPQIDPRRAPYNARGDGTTDDTAALQAAINAARDGVLLIPDPDVFYKVTDTLLIQPASGSQVRLNMEGMGSYAAIRCAVAGKAVFRTYGLMDSTIHNVKVYLDAHDTVAWDVEADVNRQSTSSVAWDSCYVSAGNYYGCAGWRGNASGGNRDLTSLAWRNTTVLANSPDYGMIAYLNLTQNGLTWTWSECKTYRVHTRYGDKPGFGFLDGAINASAQTITLDECRHLPYAGAVVIDSERITYTSRNATQLLGCTRGAGGTTAASHSDVAFVNEYTTGGALGGAGMTFVGDNNVGTRLDYFVNAPGGYTTMGGRSESGDQVLRTAINGSSSPVHVTMNGLQCHAYSGIDGTLFDLNTGTFLTLVNPQIRGIDEASDWTAAMIDAAGAAASSYGVIAVGGGMIRASDPCYQNLPAAWRVSAPSTVRSSGGELAPVGRFVPERAPSEYDARHYGAVGNGSTDDTAALQALLDLVPEGSTVKLPPGRYRFTSLAFEKTVTISGGSGYVENVGLFGNANYGVGTNETGTVLECTATSGVALDFTGADSRQATVTLRDLAIVGVGNSSRTTVGIATGTALTGTHFHRFDNLHVANFKVGMRIRFGFFVTATALNFVGCAKALHLADDANANRFFGLTAELCGEAGGAVLDLNGVDANVFQGVCIEGSVGKAIHLRNASETNLFGALYLENYGTQNATHALHIESGSDENVFDCGHYGGDATGATIEIAGARNVLRSTKYAVGPITLSGARNVWDDPTLPTGTITTNYPGLVRVHRTARILTSVDSPYTPTLADESLWCNTTDGDITVNLPPAASQIGRKITVLKIVAANNMIVDADGTENIDATTAYTITAAHEGRTLECNGASWRTIGRTS